MKFTGKYDKLINESITRFQQGGILSGDLVRITKNALKNEKVKNMTEAYKAMIENAMKTDLNLRVSSIKSSRPNTSGYYEGGQNGGTDAATDFFVDVCTEYAPGLWKDPITVPIEILEVVDTDGNLAPVPDSLKRQNKVHKTKKVKSPDEDRRTPDKNVTQKFVTKTVDGRSQTKKPQEYKKDDQGKLKKESVNTSNLEALYEAMVNPNQQVQQQAQGQQDQQTQQTQQPARYMIQSDTQIDPNSEYWQQIGVQPEVDEQGNVYVDYDGDANELQATLQQSMGNVQLTPYQQQQQDAQAPADATSATTQPQHQQHQQHRQQGAVVGGATARPA